MKRLISPYKIMVVPAESEIDPDLTMGEILYIYPKSKKILLYFFKIDGYGYSLDETLKEVFIKHKLEDRLPEAINILLHQQNTNFESQITPIQLHRKLELKEPFKLVDVREEWEIQIVKIPGSIPLYKEETEQVLKQWNKEELIVFYCHHGIRSFRVMEFFAANGFKNLKNLYGGIEAYSIEIDNSLPRY